MTGKSRKGKPRRRRSYKGRLDIEKANREAFLEASWSQRVCQVCGKGGEYQSHHVVEKQKLRIINRLDVAWDIRNAMRVCSDCHDAHTFGFRRINLDRLHDMHYEFAEHVLGTESADYLRSKYNGKDPRWDALMDRCNASVTSRVADNG